jgi:hypothetical protein
MDRDSEWIDDHAYKEEEDQEEEQEDVPPLKSFTATEKRRQTERDLLKSQVIQELLSTYDLKTLPNASTAKQASVLRQTKPSTSAASGDSGGDRYSKYF